MIHGLLPSPDPQYSLIITGEIEMNLSELTDEDLDQLRVDVLNEQAKAL